MPNSFVDKVVLVTGASSGIGRATALAFAKEGARVAVSARRADQLAETVRLIEAAGGRAMAVVCDVAGSASVQAMVAAVVSQYGRLDHAFNNAGYAGDAFIPTERYSEDTWAKVLAINLTGVFLCMKYQLPHLLESRGSIVNMASVSGLVGGPVGSAYIASKHGVVGLTKAAAFEYATKGVRVNAVAPAVIETDMTAPGLADPAVSARLIARHPMARIGTVDEVAKAVLWLCSEASSFTTGHVLPVDGGLLIT